MTRPPLVVVFVAVAIITLGVTAGAVMSQLGPQTERYARARIRANAVAHGLAGTAEYDDEVIARAVYTAEAGLSFLHTHAMGLGPIVLLAACLIVAGAMAAQGLSARLASTAALAISVLLVVLTVWYYRLYVYGPVSVGWGWYVGGATAVAAVLTSVWAMVTAWSASTPAPNRS